MTRVLLLRHGQSTWNADGRWQGRADPPLSDRGTAQALAAAGIAAAGSVGLEGVTAVVASDQHRAVRTAEILTEQLGWGEVERFAGLRERDVGEFTGYTRAEIEERWPGVLGRVPLDPPGAESRAALLARAVATLHRIAERHPARIVVAVTHGALIRAIETHLQVSEPTPPANLTGRWVTVQDGVVEAGPRTALVVP